MSVAELPRLYTEAELAAHLGVNPETLARARRAGEIPFTRIRGKKVRYTAAHLAAYLEKQECGTTSKKEAACGTSAGRTQMAPRDAHRLAREIAGKPIEPSQDMSSLVIDPKINS